MNIAVHTARAPHLVRALEMLARRGAPSPDSLLEELAGITVLVARKFTNERTADRLLEAHYLTIGCISLGIALADIAHDDGSELAFLLKQGAEQVFQAGFRHIRELAGMPNQQIVSAYDKAPDAQQNDIKSLFLKLCKADPNLKWTGDEVYKEDFKARLENQKFINCAKWLRKNHYAGSVILDQSGNKITEMDTDAVINVAVIFSILNDGRIVARINQREIESLVRSVRKAKPNFEAGWRELLKKMPLEYHAFLNKSMNNLKNKIIQKIMSGTELKTIVTEIQNYAGMEQDVDYD